MQYSYILNQHRKSEEIRMENTAAVQAVRKAHGNTERSGAQETEDSYLAVLSDIRRVSLPQLSIRTFEYTQLSHAAEIPLGLLSESELVFVTEGALHYIVSGEPITVEAGFCLCCHPGELLCREESRQPASYLSIRFWEDGKKPSISGSDRELPHCVPFSDDADVSTTLEFLSRVCMNSTPDQRKKCLAGLQLLLIQLDDFIVRYSTNDYVRAMKKYMFEHYREGVQLQDLADHVGLHPVYCAKIFKKCEGITIGAFINQLRINRAAEQLEFAVATSDVARDLGLSEFYFSRWFHQMTGVSPTEYRDTLRAGYTQD